MELQFNNNYMVNICFTGHVPSLYVLAQKYPQDNAHTKLTKRRHDGLFGKACSVERERDMNDFQSTP